MPAFETSHWQSEKELEGVEERRSSTLDFKSSEGRRVNPTHRPQMASSTRQQEQVHSSRSEDLDAQRSLRNASLQSYSGGDEEALGCVPPGGVFEAFEHP